MFNPRLMAAALCAAFAISAALVASPASAQEVGGVDLSWLYDTAVPLIGAAVTALLGVILVKFQTWTGLKIEAEHRAALEQALSRAVDFALSTVGDKTRGAMVIHTDNQLVISAASYARTAAPAALRKFGITEERLREMILARLAPPDAEQPVI